MKLIRVSQHAVDRYRERVKPALDPDQAFEDLVRCLRQHAELVDDLPAWFFDVPDGCHDRDPEVDRFDRVAMIGGDIALPLRDVGPHFLAVTCLTRAGLTEGARATVNRRNATARRRRRMRRKGYLDRAQGKREKRAGRERAA